LLGRHPDVLNTHGPLLFRYAAENGRTDVLQLLLDAGADVNGPDDADETPLAAAARHGNIDAAEWLLEHGAEIDRAPGYSATPLHVAIMEGHLPVVEFLLDRGADPNIRHGNPERNALAAARFWGQEEIAELLEQRGVSEVVIEQEPVDVEADEYRDSRKMLPPLEWFEKTWPEIYDFAMQHELESMGERNRVCFLVGYLITQLVDGGPISVYRNPSGRYVLQMPEALEKIGAQRAAQLIRQLNAALPGGAPPLDDESRWEQFEELPPAAAALGQELETLFEEWAPAGDVRLLVAQLHGFYCRD
ncbi:MAG TPA: ankyrin repeat domain-containing protein, partial [Planctomycetaceae bacterium]|nr:ankyrin repeat domain-containing protein [Planctomycetaceae bacterium]